MQASELIKRIVTIVLIVGSLYGLIKFAPVYVRYFQVKSAVVEQARISHRLNDDEILNGLNQKFEDMVVDISKDGVKVFRTPNRIEISVVYSEIVYHPWGDFTELFFNPTAVSDFGK